MTDYTYSGNVRNNKPMTEHEEYKNADVPVDIWIQRNEYLHKHIDKLNEEIHQLRRDNKRLTQQVEDQLKQFRNSGSI